MRFSRPLAVVCACVTALSIATTTSAAQRPAPPAPAASGSAMNAEDTRTALDQILEQYPPSLPRVIRIDPSLLQNDSYLQAYPQLASFLKDHSEVIHNPTYFFGTADSGYTGRLTPQERTADMWGRALEGFTVTAIVFTAVSGLLWLIKTFVDYRRWARLAKIQTDVHNKLLDRFTSNEELLAYAQTPAGRRFLEAAPLPVDSLRGLSAPFGRILMSAQIGAVLSILGLGLEVVAHQTIDDIGGPLSGIGAIVIALGVGFIVSAFLAYVLSRRFGLVNETPEARG